MKSVIIDSAYRILNTPFSEDCMVAHCYYRTHNPCDTHEVEHVLISWIPKAVFMLQNKIAFQIAYQHRKLQR